MALFSSASAFSAAPSCFSDPSSFASVCSVSKVAAFQTCWRKLVVFSVTSVESVRRPALPRAGSITKPTALISERVICTDAHVGSKIELKYAKAPGTDFCEFIETAPKEEVVAFFRDIAEEVEGFRELRDFHMKVRDGASGFRVEVFFNEERNGPDVSPYDDCIGCSPDVNLFVGQEPGMASKDCILEEFSDRPYAVCRLDAKGRSGFSIMPVRHVERMAELDDNELYAMWAVAVKTVRQIGVPFISLIMNHGTYRSLYHLNLKVWVTNESLERLLSMWSEERREVWDKLQKYAANRPKKQKVCFFFRRDGYCRHGEFCSYLHSFPKSRPHPIG